jgi:hypothetical protein
VGVRVIVLTWDLTPYRNHAYVEVWRNTVNNLATAALFDTPFDNIFSDPTGSAGVTYYYWVRAVNLENTPGAFNAVAGTSATIGQDIAELQQILVGKVTASQLYIDLATPLLSLQENLDDTASSALAAMLSVHEEQQRRAAALLDEARDRGTALTETRRVIAEGDAQLAQSITTLTATVGGNQAAVLAALQVEQLARATADGAEAAQRESLAAQVNDPATGLPATRATLLSDYSTTANMNTAIALSTSTVTARLNNFGGSGVAVETAFSAQASATTGLQGQYTVKIDINGYVSGFGLASTAVGAAPFSQFVVRADSFAIAAPSGPGITPLVPFIVRTTPSDEGGVTLAPGVYIDSANIVNLSVLYARIASLVADEIITADLSADRIVAGTLDVNRIAANSLTVDKLQVGTLSAGWVFAGSLSAATGTFSGSLSAATGTFAGALSAASGTFNGSLSNGTAARSGTTMTGSGISVLSDATGCWGNSETNLTFDGTSMRMNGRWVNQDNLNLAVITVTLSSYFANFTDIGSAGGVVSVTASASGGTSPYTFIWSMNIDVVSGSASASVSPASGATVSIGASASGTGASVIGTATCTAIDANGRVGTAAFTISATESS